VTDQPTHPYTKLLLSAAPDPDRQEKPSLRGRGAPPNLITPPSGCRFHPRCPHAMRICADTVPALTDAGGGDESACWLHATDLGAAQRTPLRSYPASDAA
jgi:peptide/nickel transport system ATP-binding protein